VFRKADGGGGVSGTIVFLLSRMSDVVRRCAEPAVSKFDLPDLVETIREGLHDPDLTVWIASRCSGVKFTVSPEGTRRDREAR
jgi:hypothetical protein